MNAKKVNLFTSNYKSHDTVITLNTYETWSCIHMRITLPHIHSHYPKNVKLSLIYIHTNKTQTYDKTITNAFNNLY